ncbi:hypothetical protein HAP47_0001450 [Bradyrhizobium sp. 41S5]|uniref:hypothetical protein n=1 Tax=Bradyrhizobium sp. 41S5 TaxID=1404443 RepID=UPI00156A87EF|nr:hypothetical protein [Bradyrhizobium sp. 41S5]UFX45425.1 hypothetical protein HAP47_0001450 [Bradyrhizobium sp. 41S5]
MTNARVTAHAIELYRELVAMHGKPGADVWEEDGGQRRHYLDIGQELHVLLSRKAWDEAVADTFGCTTPPHWMKKDERRIASWWSAYEVRVALDNAIAE